MKLLLKILAALLVLIVVAILALIFLFDLNRLKPSITSAAQEQGIDLQIGGDLGWTFWPSVGVTVEDVRVAPLAAVEQPIAQVKKASLLVALKPLFSGAIQVQHIQVDGAIIHLLVDKKGQGNWEAITDHKAAENSDTTQTPAKKSVPENSATANAEDADKNTPDTATDDLQLAIERISLSNSSLHYRNAQSGQDLAVEDVQFDVRKFNLKGEPFTISLSLKTTVTEQQTAPSKTAPKPLVIELSLNNKVQLTAVDPGLQSLEGKLNISVNEQGKVAANYNLNAVTVDDASHFTGAIEVPSFDAKKLLTALGVELATNEKNALTKVALNTKISVAGQQVRLEPLTINVDKTKINGQLLITDLETGALRLVLNGDEINIDDYLAPAAEDDVQVAAAPAAETADTPLPLEALRDLNAELRLTFNKLTIADMPVENIQLHINAKKGMVNLTKADGQIYQGTMVSKGSLDARTNIAQMQFTSTVKGLGLAPAMRDLELDEKLKMSGAINADVVASSRGATVQQFMNALVAEANLSGAQVRMAPLNIEQQFCQIMDKVKEVEEDPNKVWDKFTDMHDVSGKVTLAQEVITVEHFTAGVHQLLMGTQGQINLASDDYNFTLPLKLLALETSEGGCNIKNNYWLNRSLSLLRCKGSLTNLNPVKDCGLDSQGLKDLTKQYLTHKLRKDVIGEEDSEADLATGLLNSLIKKNRKKQAAAKEKAAAQESPELESPEPESSAPNNTAEPEPQSQE